MWLSEQLHAMWSSSSHVERLSIGQQRSQAWTPSGAPSWQLTPRGLPSILKMNLQNPVETFQIKSCATEINCLHWSGSICQKVKVAVAHLCLTLCDPMDCSPPGSSVHGISQARILEWVATSFSRGSTWPMDETSSPALQADSLLFEPPRKPSICWISNKEMNVIV